MNRSKYHASISKPVTIRGVTYVSAWVAARAFGCSPQNIQRARRDGCLDGVGTLKKKPRPVEAPDGAGR